MLKTGIHTFGGVTIFVLLSSMLMGIGGLFIMVTYLDTIGKINLKLPPWCDTYIWKKKG
jgi:hypothetical protein